MISATTKISNNKFLLVLQNEQTGILQKVTRPRKGLNIYDYVYRSDKFSEREKFTLKTAALIQEIDFKIDKVQVCFFLIQEYPYPLMEYPFAASIPITEGEFFEYHMEAYLVHSLGLRDRVLAATNFLFDLNINEKRLYGNMVLEKIKGADLHVPLSNFLDMLKTIEESRHSVVHKYRFD